jgi:uncharacterized repeat protein (TIGR04042 family)
MPEVHFTVQLPDGAKRHCYSPSTVVKKYFAPGEQMPVTEFLDRSRQALSEASERVRQRYGFACTSAMAQLAEIEQFSRGQPAAGTVTIIDI